MLVKNKICWLDLADLIEKCPYIKKAYKFVLSKYYKTVEYIYEEMI